MTNGSTDHPDPETGPEGTCPNCGHPAPGRYCPDCGQRQGELIPALWSLLNETLGELLFVEGRLPRTLRALFWPPGFLTQEWWQGRRASYVSPIRLYLLAALPFFFLFSLPREESVYESTGILEFLVWVGYETSNPSERYEPLQPLPAELAEDSAARAAWTARMQQQREEHQARQEAQSRTLDAGFSRILDLLPILVGIIMVPFLAVILSFGMRSKEGFVARLVLSLHLHTVGYMLAAVGWLVGWELVLGLYGPTLYFGGALRRLKGESLLTVALAAIVVLVSYAGGFLLVYVGLVQGLTWVAPDWVFATR